MRILGVDYGEVRTGLALSDPLEMLASAVETVTAYQPEKAARAGADKALALKAEHIVLGLPKNLNGTSGDRIEVTRKFAHDLTDKLPDMEIVFWDERLTTVQAAGILNVTNTRGKDRKNVIDTVAASIILQSYLDSLS